jgi:hypothetical protein
MAFGNYSIDSVVSSVAAGTVVVGVGAAFSEGVKNTFGGASQNYQEEQNSDSYSYGDNSSLKKQDDVNGVNYSSGFGDLSSTNNTSYWGDSKIGDTDGF